MIVFYHPFVISGLREILPIFQINVSLPAEAAQRCLEGEDGHRGREEPTPCSSYTPLIAANGSSALSIRLPGDFPEFGRCSATPSLPTGRKRRRIWHEGLRDATCPAWRGNVSGSLVDPGGLCGRQRRRKEVWGMRNKAQRMRNK